MDEQESKLACSGCGASLAYAAGAQALKCQYCNTITEISSGEDELEDVPDYVVPLSVEKDDLERAAYQYMASGKYTPDDLLEQAVISKVERFYAPAYIFSGDYDAQWTATFGYDHTEHYTAFESRTENGRTRQVPVTKTKTVTDWRPVNGSDSGDFAVYAYGGSSLPERVVHLVEYTDGAITPYDVSYVSGVDVTPFTVSESSAYSNRADPKIDEIIDRSVKQHAQGDHQRDWHWTANIRKDCNTVIVPVCRLLFEYEGKPYEIWTDGTNPDSRVADELPKDQKRQRNVQLGFIPAGAATVALLGAGLATPQGSLFSALDLGTLAIVGGAWGYGFWRRHSILNYSIKLRQSLLSERTASKTNLATLGEEAGQELADSFRAPDRPWMLDTKKDRRALAAGTAAFCVAVLLASFGHKIGSGSSSSPSGSETVIQASAPATAPVAAAPQPEQKPAEAVAEAPKPAEGQENAAAPAGNETVAATTGLAPAEAATQTVAQTQQVAGGAPVPGTVAAPAVPTVAAGPVAAPAAAAPAAAGNTSGDILVAVLQASAKADWNAVDAQVQRLKPAAVLPRGDRKVSRAANAEGLQALQQKDYPAAVGAFERAVRADASDIEVRNNLGFAYMQARRFDHAVNTIGEVLILTPERSSAWANLAEALAQSERVPGAEASLRLAVRYSANRQKTVDYLNRMVETHASDKFREVATRVLRDIGSIPQSVASAAAIPVAAPAAAR